MVFEKDNLCKRCSEEKTLHKRFEHAIDLRACLSYFTINGRKRFGAPCVIYLINNNLRCCIETTGNFRIKRHRPPHDEGTYVKMG